jgi:hypothetical protein
MLARGGWRGTDVYEVLRQYAAINVLQRWLPISLLLKGLSNERYPLSLRACFCRSVLVTFRPCTLFLGVHTRARFLYGQARLCERTG